MDYSSCWNQLLINVSTGTCLRANASLNPGLQIINSIVYMNASTDTNSSISSETSSIQPQDEQANEPKNRDDDEDQQSVVDKTKEQTNEATKSIQRIRYSKEEYRCIQCPYNCTTEKAFIKHVRWCVSKSESSTGTLFISCPVCGKDRRNEETLSVHMMKHKDDKYFCCDICKFKSLQLKKLIQHRRMHTGEKPHLCPYCSYRSSRRDNLRSHVRRLHRKDDLPGDTFTPISIVLSPRKST